MAETNDKETKPFNWKGLLLIIILFPIFGIIFYTLHNTGMNSDNKIIRVAAKTSLIWNIIRFIFLFVIIMGLILVSIFHRD